MLNRKASVAARAGSVRTLGAANARTQETELTVHIAPRTRPDSGKIEASE